MSEKKLRNSPRRAMIPVIRILNPFDSRQQEHSTIQWRAKKTLAKYFPEFETREVVVSVSGRIIPKEEYAVTYLDKTDNVVICPIPQGGGSGKQVFAMVAMIAVAVFAPYAAAALNGVGGMATVTAAGALTTTGMVVAAGISMAGSMLVNAIFAPPKPTSGSGETKSSYGVDGAKNTSIEGIPVPVCYGKYRTAGNILGMYTTTDGDDNQTLYMLISAGEGPIASISDIEINDNPITDYHDVEIQTRLGTANQEVIPWFNDTLRAINKGQKLTTDWFYSTTTGPVDKLRLDFMAPTGIAKIDTKSGDARNHEVDVLVEYRKVGASSWSTLPLQTDVESWEFASYDYHENGWFRWMNKETGGMIDDLHQKAYLEAAGLTIDDGSGNLVARYPIYSQRVTIKGHKKGTVRRSYTSDKLEPAEYEVRVRRAEEDSKEDNVLDDVYLTDINEITLDDLSYPHTALLALKIKMTDQLSGVPNVTYINGGKIISVYENDEWLPEASSNPAWIVWDILTNRRYGGAMPTSRLDFIAFQEFAQYCKEQDLTWNGPIETETNVWDAAQMVLRVGHSQIVPTGTRYTVITEKPAVPVMMFSVANMIEGSYKETWLGRADRANEIDVTFFDRTDKYRQRTIKVVDPAALASGAPQRNSAITLYGVVDYDKAYKEAQLQLNLNHYVLKTVTFGAPLEAIACRVGDLIYVQNDLTDWAQAGRFEAGSTTSVMKLDRPVKMAAGKSYKLLTMRDAVKRATCLVTNVIGNSVFLSGYSDRIVAKRLQGAGKDAAIDGTFDTGVIVDNAAGFKPGQEVSLWDTDVIEEYNVVTAAGESSTVTLQAPCSSAPAQFTQWMFGEATKVKQPFRIKAITGSSDYRRDITAIEYREEVYDATRYAGSQPVALNPGTPIGIATDLSVYEETYVAGDSIANNVVASWAPPRVGLYAGADVYVSRNDGEVQKISEAKNRTSCKIAASRGDKLSVRVVAYDVFGKRSQYSAAPVVEYKVIGEIPKLEVGNPTGVGFAWAGRDCKINWRYNATTHSYEFGSEPEGTGADAGSLDPHFKDYEIRVYDSTHTVLRRTEYTTDNSYVYIYDKNFADGLTRDLVFEIRQRDTFNNLSDPAILEAHNPPPTITAMSADPSFDSVAISCQHSGDSDFAGIQVWVAEHREPIEDITNPLAEEYLVYSGPDTACVIGRLMFNQDHYYRVAAYDAFGATGMVPSEIRQFKTDYFNVETIKDQMIPVAKFAKEIDPVGIVDVLPDPLTWVRPTVVLLSTDGKMYRLVNKAWTSAVPAADVTGQLVSSQIANAAITTAKFAAGISPVGVVSALPAVAGYTGPKVVTLTTDGKLYRLTGSPLAWTAAVEAADVTGQLTDAQIKSIDAAKVAGQLTAEQIGKIAATQIDGQLTDAQIKEIAAAKMTGTITAAQIAAGAIDNTKFASGLSAVSIVAALPAVSGYTGPKVVMLSTDGKLYRLTGSPLAWTSAIPSTDLTGQITSTQIKDDAITTAKIAANAITAAEIAAGTITATELAADSVTTAKIQAGAVTASEIAADAVTTEKLAAGAVTADEIAAGAITTAKISAGAVSANEIAAGAITTAKIAADAITTAKIAAGAVTASEIAADAIVSDKIAANAITSTKISAGAVEAAAIAAGAITTAKLAAGAVTATELAAGAVTTAKLAAGAVTANEIAANTITSAKIAAGAVTATEIAADAITSAKIAAGAVTADELAAGAVTTAKLAAGAVTADTIAANAITTGKIAAGAISTDQLAANAITAAKLATTQLLTTSAQIGDGLIVAAKIGTAEVGTLKIAGNAVTIPVSAYTSGEINTTFVASTVVQSATIVSSGAPIWVSFGAYVSPSSYGEYDSEGRAADVMVPWFLELWRGGTLLFSIESPMSTGYGGTSWIATPGLASFEVQDTPGWGTFTYELKVRNPQPVNKNFNSNQGTPGKAKSRIINLLEVKR